MEYNNEKEMENIITNHFRQLKRKRLEMIKNMSLENLLISVNPYLLKVQKVYMASEIIKKAMESYLTPLEDNMLTELLHNNYLLTHNGRKEFFNLMSVEGVRDEEFENEYSKRLNRLTKEFTEYYCDSSGSIIWNKLVK